MHDLKLGLYRDLKAFLGILYLKIIALIILLELIETPKIGRKLPDTLSITEIDAIIAAIDLATNEGGAQSCDA